MTQRSISPDILKIPLSKLETDEYRAEGIVRGEDLELNFPEAPADSLFRLSIHAYSLGREKMVQGHIEGSLKLRCARCDVHYGLPFGVKYIHCYVPGSPKDEFDTPPDGDFYFTNDSPYLDPGKGIREEILLQVPMKPIPEPDHDAHCEQCEGEFEESFTASDEPDVDPRLAVLAKLLKKNES